MDAGAEQQAHPTTNTLLFSAAVLQKRNPKKEGVQTFGEPVT